MIQFRKRPAQLPTSSGPCRSHWINKLESEIREMAFGGENVTPDSLKQRGFSEAIISRFGKAAIDMARRRSVRRIDHVEA